MTLVTRGAAVHIPIYVRVLEIAGVVVAMAARALEYRVVSTIDVTCGAYAVCIAMTGGKLRVVSVWERRTGPIARAHAVAGPALCNREERDVRARGMGWLCGPVVVGLMACTARVAVQTVIVVDVAVGAYPRWHSVQPDQRETRVVVIEGGIGPVNRVVARFAGRGESSRRVRRASRSRVILLMARVAERAIQRIVVADVTIGAQTRRHGV